MFKIFLTSLPILLTLLVTSCTTAKVCNISLLIPCSVITLSLWEDSFFNTSTCVVSVFVDIFTDRLTRNIFKMK